MAFRIKDLFSKLVHRDHQRRNVALVLSGGGARGLAHIGAIESLEQHGYNICSVAGSSIGALVGGIYAAGKMDEMKTIVTGMSRKQVVQMLGFSPGLDHISNGQRIMQLLDSIIGDVKIEDLALPFCCSASDLVSGEEYVFREGPLKDAIRASISIPGFFKPVDDGKHIFVDGSVHNALPLDQVKRTKDDLLVAVNVSAPDKEPYNGYLTRCDDPENEADKPIWRRISFLKTDFSANYMNMTARIMKLTVQNNTQMAMRLTPPDVCAEIETGRFGIFDFDKATAIIDYGKTQMDEALDKMNCECES